MDYKKYSKVEVEAEEFLPRGSPNIQIQERNGVASEGIELDSRRLSQIEASFDGQNQTELVAISVQNASKKYGSKKVLENLSMEIKEGQIYALLGSSGCGKTTLLSLILGLRKLDKGSISIFGYEPGTKESGVPGSRVGYMPQDLSLFEEMRVREVVHYFGRIYGMRYKKIEERMRFLLKLLKLDDDSKIIRNLSGGQQRRVSFTVSLIHDAKLLILDEPTVGVDPLLRQCIWGYLNNLVASSKTTILITTHYIEEANNASMIAFLRNGRILVEDTPSKLKEEHNCELEEIVLRLCQKDENTSGSNTELHPNGNVLANDLESPSPKRGRDQNKYKYTSRVENQGSPWDGETSSPLTRIQALVIRNFIRMWRNIGFIAFLLFFPGSGVFLICLAVGGEIRGMNMGLVNEETRHACDFDLWDIDLCSRENISCHFPTFFPHNKINWKYFDTEEEAAEAANDGQVWGYLVLPSNFSEIFPAAPENKMRISMDYSNLLVAQELATSIQEAFTSFTDAWFANCSNINGIKHPIIFNELFGGENTSFTVYISPAVHLLLIFFMGLSLTGLVLILEKKSGLFERSITAGVTQNEIVISHFLSQYGVMLLQAFISLAILFFAFDLPLKGSTGSVILLTILQGTLGILVGFVISTVCNEESSVLQLAITVTLPLFMLSGVVWPLNGMPDLLKYVAYTLPLGFASESLRSIMSRGWGILHPYVWPGFASISIWILVVTLVIFLLNKVTRKK